MLYEGKNPVLQVIGVERLQWAGGSFQVAPRQYSALALRVRGSTLVTVAGTEYYVNTGDVLYLPQGIPYTAQYSDTDMVVIHFIAAENDPVPEVYCPENSRQLYDVFLQAQRLWQEKAPGYGVYALSRLYHILGMIADGETKSSIPVGFSHGVAYIHRHFADSTLSVDRICRQAGISQTQFRLLFQKYYQKTPVEYITTLRLEQARNLIASGIPVEQAAQESGFRDPKYFARTVKKYFGCTPRDWKTYGK